MATIKTLTRDEAAGSGYTHAVVLTAADIIATATVAASPTYYSIYPGFSGTTTNTNLLVSECDVFVKTAVVCTQTNGTAVTLVIKVGDGSTRDLFVAASTNLKTTGWKVGKRTTPTKLAGDIITYLITVGANWDPTKTTAGEVWIFLKVVDGDTLCKVG